MHLNMYEDGAELMWIAMPDPKHVVTVVTSAASIVPPTVPVGPQIYLSGQW
jgi:hypothetical protein